MRHVCLLMVRMIGIGAAVVLLVQQPGGAQTPQLGEGINSGRVTFAANTQSALAESNVVLARMMQTGELASIRVQDDPQIAGRQIQTLQQVYKGIPVEGGSVTLQTAGATTVSAFGTVYNSISLDTTPAIAPVDAARIIEKTANAAVVFGASPTLTIVPSPAGSFALTYKATVANGITYYVDAASGDVVQVFDEKNFNTGHGTGALGDSKKMATTQIGGAYRTKDTLRPGGISTYDTGGSDAVLDRIENRGEVSDNDLASNPTNTWTNGYVVDVHTNTGFTYDYFFRQHNWSALDGNSRPVTSIVHSGLVNNAYFLRAPFGPGGNGLMVFGRTGASAPVATLDVAAHELMHGVTYFALRNRTGSGFVSVVHTVLGPTAFVFNGTTFSCNNTVFVDGLGAARPPFCSNGRFVLGASHTGAINEAVSDVFGTAVEFFYQPAGSGPLRADYDVAEDITGLGPFRSLSNPSSVSLRHDSGTLAYPDHVSKMLNYVLMVTSGTSTAPTTVAYTGVGVSNGNTLFFFENGTDGGGVHRNSTVFSHAFYLAVEGGRNATSGLTVTGVGAANRAQIEKIFFRAQTQLMPNNASFTIAAAAVVQAAIDLYGTSAAATQAVAQAMTAVGLR